MLSIYQFIVIPLGFQIMLQRPSEVYPRPLSKVEPFGTIAFVAKISISDAGTCPGSNSALYFR